jgi:hypothetical protein
LVCIFIRGCSNFGAYYLWVNFQEYVRSGRLSVSQATTVSEQQANATAVRQVTVIAQLPTRRPSATAKPPCQDFSVSANTAIMRQAPSTNSGKFEVLSSGTIVCVLDGVDGDDSFQWYLIDRDPNTQLIETGYMREDVIQSLNPTPTPSNTPLAAPSVTANFTEPANPTLAPQRTAPPSITPSSNQ